jgi:hypothetical protein
MHNLIQTTVLLVGLVLFGCSTKTSSTLKDPTILIVSKDDKASTNQEGPMSGAWVKDEPRKICPISGGAPSESSDSSEDKNVTNGSAFDCYGFSFGGVSTLIIPEGVELTESAGADTIIVKANKTLAFSGHPPKPMSPETARNNMGLAYKLEGDILTLATYGEFATKEGGASIKLVVLVPPKREIERRKDLNGPNSLAATTTYPANEKDYWYTGNKPAAGWIAFKAVPDPGSR